MAEKMDVSSETLIAAAVEDEKTPVESTDKTSDNVESTVMASDNVEATDKPSDNVKSTDKTSDNVESTGMASDNVEATDKTSDNVESTDMTSDKEGPISSESMAPVGEWQKCAVDQECQTAAAPANEPNSDSSEAWDRVQVQNLNTFMSYKQVKAFLTKVLGGIAFRKLRHFSDTAYLSFESPADAQKAVGIIDGQILKQRTITARLAEPEPLKGRDITKRPNDDGNDDDRKRAKIITCAKEIVTPLADMPYEQQLEFKQKESSELAKNLFRQLVKANVENSYGYSVSKHLKQIIPSPVQTAYRNKCEFTVGKNTEGETTVGFVGGRFSANMHYVVSAETCNNISEHMKRIVKSFEHFVKESGLPTFNEFERVGCWKMLTVREFLGDCMVIATVFPFEDENLEKEMKQRLADYFLDPSNFTSPEKRFRVTSVYWQVQKNASDPQVYEIIGGASFVIESLYGTLRFRVSPGSFFQTNSRGAEVLFSTITSACGFGFSDDPVTHKVADVKEEAEKKEDAQPEENKDGVEKMDTVEEQEKPKHLLLDVCCGTGTIGLCIDRCVQKAIRAKKFSGSFYGLGIEMVPEAIEDAKKNAAANGVGEDRFRFIAAKAEDAFRDLQYFLPKGVTTENANVVGVIDPPRAGIHERVVLTCRKMEKLNRLVFVSCDPKAALKNIVDLCRPRSRKYEGEPFRVQAIEPVDMFPQTKHFEWVVTLVR